mgnify:CR=1 FL=1
MPTPLRIKKYSKIGIKTIINLRGVRKDGGWLLENEACQKYNTDYKIPFEYFLFNYISWKIQWNVQRQHKRKNTQIPIIR